MNSSQARNVSFHSPVCLAGERDVGKLYKPSSLIQGFLIFYIVINIIRVPFTAVLNALVIIAVKKKSRLRAQKTNIVLAMLALTDFLVGILAQPLFVAGLIAILHMDLSNGRSCFTEIFLFAIANCLLSSSFLHLLLASGERYVAIKHPFDYITIVTESLLLIVSLLAWVLSVIVQIPLAVDETVFYILHSAVIGLSVVVIVFSHFSVFLETRRHENQVAAQQVTQEARKQFEKDKKAFKLTAILVGVLLLCCTPFMFIRIVFYILEYEIHFEAFHVIVFFATTVVFLNSLLNPMIYCIRIRQFRVAFIELTFRNVSLPMAEEIEMQWFGAPDGANRRETGQHERRQDQQNIERANVNELNTAAGY